MVYKKKTLFEQEKYKIMAFDGK